MSVDQECASQSSSNTITLSHMNDSKLYLFLFMLIGNYFFTLLIIGLAAAWISLLRKAKPLEINAVAEAFLSYYMLFPVGISNLINFVFHVFFGDMAAKFIGWETAHFRLRWDLLALASALQGSLHLKEVYHSDSLR